MNGLSTPEATERLARLGPNALPEQPPEPLWLRFLRQFNSPLIFILLFALAFDFGLWVYEGAHGWPIEATAIGLILLFNAALGLYQEQRSEAALAGLKALAGAQAWVLRDGEFVRLPTQDVVPGLPNRYLHAAVLGGIAIQLAAASVPVVSTSLGNAAIPAELWILVFGGALLSWGLAEALSRIVWQAAVPGRRE